MVKKKDPRIGTGKKPKGSGRRLYTDENPKDTVGIKYATPADARATVAKVNKIKKPFARKIQILTVMEQRSKVAGKRNCWHLSTKRKAGDIRADGLKKVTKVPEELDFTEVENQVWKTERQDRRAIPS